MKINKKIGSIFLVVAMLLIMLMSNVNYALAEENTTEKSEKEETYTPPKEVDELLKDIEHAKKIYNEGLQKAAEKYGEDFVKTPDTSSDLVNKLQTRSARSVGNTVYTQVLKPNVVGITVVQYFPGGGYDVKLNWTEGILGASTGKQLFCADPTANFTNGYKTGVEGTRYFSEYTIKFVAAIFYYYDNYMCKGLNNDQDYIMKQIAFWYFANMSKNWYPSCYFDFSSNIYCDYGHNLFDHRTELLDGAGLNWANANWDKMDADMTVYEGSGQPLMDLSYQYNPTGTLKLKKASANTEITENNTCYSLKGAEYGVYKEKACTNLVGTLTTDENGNSNGLQINAGTYYVKETKAPPGYVLDPIVYTATVTAGKETELKVFDIPTLDPVGVLLGKIDAETNKNKPQGSASLEGAHFEVKYYKGLYTEGQDPAELGKTSERTWIFETDDDGFCEYQKEYFVSGDELYYSPSGDPSLPIGTITIQETKAPEGYLLNPEIYVVQITSTNDGSEFVYTYNMPEIPEDVLKLEIVKTIKGAEQVIPGAVFKHTLPDGSTEEVTTDQNGKAVLKGLTWGTHVIEEVSVPDGIVKNPGKVTFTVAKDNKITVDSNTSTNENGIITFSVNDDGNASMQVEDILAPYELIVHKENENAKKLAGAEFTLYSDKECTKEIQKVSSNENGEASFSNLKVETKYYLKETKAPQGYQLPLNNDGSAIIYEIYTISNPIKGTFEYYVNGKPQTEITGSVANREVNMTVVNHTGIKMPETGSPFTLGILLTGMGCLVLAGWWYHKGKKGEEKKNDEKE